VCRNFWRGERWNVDSKILNAPSEIFLLAGISRPANCSSYWNTLQSETTSSSSNWLVEILRNRRLSTHPWTLSTRIEHYLTLFQLPFILFHHRLILCLVINHHLITIPQWRYRPFHVVTIPPILLLLVIPPPLLIVITIPHNVINIPHNVITIPHNVITIPQNLITIPHNVITIPQNVIAIPRNVITIPLTVSLIYLMCGQWRSAGDFHKEPEYITDDLKKKLFWYLAVESDCLN